MNSRFLAKSLTVVFVQFLAFAPSAFASLGLGTSSIAADAKALSCKQGPISNLTNYKVYELICGFGSILEYLDSSKDRVFGISWNGIAHPDLKILLGSYYERNRAALEQPGPGRRAATFSIETNDLKLKKWGYGLKLGGRVFDPALLVPGVKPDEIL